MIRNLKVLLAAAMALAAFGAFSATAHAAEEKFHCEVEPCSLTFGADGTGVTAHQVFIVENAAKETASFTCTSVTGDATSNTKTVEEITATGLLYNTCKVNGTSEVKVRMNECDYLFTSKKEAGGSVGGATIHVQCVTAKHIEIEIVPTGCVLEVTPQTLRGATYKNIGAGATRETTVEPRVSSALSGTSIAVEVGKVGTGCLPKAALGDTLVGSYTTGNVLATAEKDNGLKEMVGGWWE